MLETPDQNHERIVHNLLINLRELCTLQVNAPELLEYGKETPEPSAIDREPGMVAKDALEDQIKECLSKLKALEPSKYKSMVINIVNDSGNDVPLDPDFKKILVDFKEHGTF